MLLLFIITYEIFIYFVSIVNTNQLLYKMIQSKKKVITIEKKSDLSSLSNFDVNTLLYIKNASYYDEEYFNHMKSLLEDLDSNQMEFDVYPWFSLVYLCSAERVFFRYPKSFDHVFYLNNHAKKVLRIILFVALLRFNKLF